ncbi:hypothetical protein CYLTODRAFT_443150 [Cylindrobasidium torrendii FP15055 ss-10]|uniref:F-box domain-containing protein n=1 Tax=Cylindrobasidium torrendii FP15055 ss-10 TaxID=1314674 RepID=A0A0D7BEV7_9AGAR|nr:hypothetical protein CYLTODRAFT_443150 [Cylindrobasidium torrendii FP15055 ss-10]
MAKLVDLPAELLDIVLSDLAGDGNKMLKRVCLVGNRKLTQIARRLSFRHIRIALKFPLSERHPFYRRFRGILDNPSLCASVRTVQFACEGHQDSIKLSQFLNKNLGRLSNVTHAYLVCNSEDACWLGCISRIILLSLITIPSLRHLSIRGCQCLCDDYFPISSSTAELDTLTLEDVKLESRGSSDGWASILRSVSGVKTLNMKNCRWSTDGDTSGCLSAAIVLKELQMAGATAWSSIRKLHVGCSCEPCQWYCQADARQLAKLCECELPHLEELAVISRSSEVFACTTTTMQDIGNAFGASLKRLWLSFPQCQCFTPNELLNAAPKFRELEELAIQDQGTNTAYASAFSQFQFLTNIHFLPPMRNPPRRLTAKNARDMAAVLVKNNAVLQNISWQSSDITIQIREGDPVIYDDAPPPPVLRNSVCIKKESSDNGLEEPQAEVEGAAQASGSAQPVNRDVKEEDVEAEDGKDMLLKRSITSHSYCLPAWLDAEWLQYETRELLAPGP